MSEDTPRGTALIDHIEDALDRMQQSLDDFSAQLDEGMRFPSDCEDEPPRAA